jgi:hypothetical protein
MHGAQQTLQLYGTAKRTDANGYGVHRSPRRGRNLLFMQSCRMSNDDALPKRCARLAAIVVVPGIVRERAEAEEAPDRSAVQERRTSIV